MEWQPIETAPTGEGILCALSYGVGVVIAHQENKTALWVTDGGSEFLRHHITHWMPLPKPPVTP